MPKLIFFNQRESVLTSLFYCPEYDDKGTRLSGVTTKKSAERKVSIMQRKFLEDLGIDKDTIDKIMDENSKDIGKAKGSLEDTKTELDKLKGEITNRDKQLEDLKKLNPEGLKEQIQKLQDDNKKAKEEYEAQIKTIKIENAVERALTGAGAKNTKAVKALLDLATAELDGDNVKGLDAQIKKLQESEDSKFLFNIASVDDGTKFKGTKPGESKDKKPEGITKEQFKVMGYKERTALYSENPELYEALSKED